METKTTAYPGGREEQSGTYDVQDVGEDDEQVQQEPSTKRRKLHNPWLAAEEVSQQFVMRLLQSAKNFIQQRLNDEQSD